MTTQKNILHYLPESRPKKTAQARIDLELHDQVTEVLAQRSLTWVDLIDGACREFLDSVRNRPKGQK